MKTELTSEQTDHLISLGVPKKLAGKWPVIDVDEDVYDPMYPEMLSRPIFILDDFLNGEILPRLLPKGNNKHYKLTIHPTENLKWSVSYLDMDDYVDFYHMNTLKVEVELIDALYQLTCWYYEEHLKNKEES